RCSRPGCVRVGVPGKCGLAACCRAPRRSPTHPCGLVCGLLTARPPSRFPLRRGDLLSSWTSLRQRMGAPDALVAQGIERLPPEQKAVGSNPIEGTTETPPVHGAGGVFLCL